MGDEESRNDFSNQMLQLFNDNSVADKSDPLKEQGSSTLQVLAHLEGLELVTEDGGIEPNKPKINESDANSKNADSSILKGEEEDVLEDDKGSDLEDSKDFDDDTEQEDEKDGLGLVEDADKGDSITGSSGELTEIFPKSGENAEEGDFLEETEDQDSGDGFDPKDYAGQVNSEQEEDRDNLEEEEANLDNYEEDGEIVKEEEET